MNVTKGWGWGNTSPSPVVSAEESDAIQYLIDEWDFGRLER
jgi:hypothetical protein